MINLLPDEKKALIRNLYRGRLFCVGGYFLASLLTIFIIFILTVYAGEYWQYRAILKRSAGRVLPAEAKILSDLREAKSRLKLVNRGSSVDLPHVLTTTLLARPLGVSVKQISFSQTETKRLLILSGESATRDDLLAYLDNLRSLSIFSQVSSPLSNLLKNRDTEFTIELILSE